MQILDICVVMMTDLIIPLCEKITISIKFIYI